MFYCRTNVERGNKKFEDAVKSYSLLTSSTFPVSGYCCYNSELSHEPMQKHDAKTTMT